MTVQDGFTVPDAALLPSTQLVLEGYLADTVEIATSMGVGTHKLIIETGVLDGIVATVTVASDATTGELETSTYIPGGMWIVKGMWTFSGVENPFASYQNMFVFTSWMMLFLGVAILLPPIRTIRSAVWRGMIPAALKDTAGILRAHSEIVLKEGNDDDNNNNNNDDDKIKIAQLHGKCIYHMNALFNGTLAKYTVFEPRLLTNPVTHPPECTVYYLAQLSLLVARASAAAIGIQLFSSREFCYENLITGVYSKAADNLDICAKALATGNVAFLDDIKYSDNIITSSSVDAGDAGEEVLQATCEDAFEMNNRVKEIAAVSRKWLMAMSDTRRKDGAGLFTKESLGAIMQNVTPVRSSEEEVLTNFKRLCLMYHFSNCNILLISLPIHPVDPSSLFTLHSPFSAPYRAL